MSVTVEIKGIALEVQCLYRFQCYRKRLKEARRRLRRELAGEPSMQWVLNNPCLLQPLSDQLDKIVKVHLRRDLQTLEASNFIKTHRERGENGVQILQRYLHFRDHGSVPERNRFRRFARAGKFYRYLKKKYPSTEHCVGLKEQLEEFKENYIQAVTKSLARVRADHHQVMNLFFPGEERPEEIVLTDLDFAEGDSHKQGQRVLILSFSRFSEEGLQPIGRVVYKPSSVLVDMLIIGDTALIRENEELSQKVFSSGTIRSFSEIINSKLEDDQTLPVYQVYPRENQEGLHESYGYIQHLPHEPWYSMKDLQDEFVRFREEHPDLDPASLIAYADRLCIEKEFEVLHSAVEVGSENADYLLEGESDVKAYSNQVGLVITLLVGVLSKDAHLENLRASGKRAIPHDLEVSFQPGSEIIETILAETLLFEPAIGSLMPKTKSTVSFDCLVSVDDLAPIPSGIMHCNRMYELKEGAAVFCRPEIRACLAGIENFLSALSEVTEETNEWLNHPLVKSMTLRMLPYSTRDLMVQQKGLEEFSFDRKQFDVIRRAEIEEYLAAEQNFPVMPAIYFSSYCYDEFRTGNLPVFYTRANETRLWNGRGEEVWCDVKKDPGARQGEEAPQGVVDLDTVFATQYQEKTPLAVLTQNISALREPAQQEKLISETRRIITDLSREAITENRDELASSSSSVIMDLRR